ncbi:hypothetical protein [Rhodopila sp.]|uniref:hypothetical protein n=1 Tax=Rhodopila sp. TaxID=2480087 RepID=UPI003D0C4007
MFTHRPLLDEQDDQKVADRQTAGLLGIAITLVLLVVGLFLVQQLRSSAAIEDCLMAGRTNCGPPASLQR